MKNVIRELKFKQPVFYNKNFHYWHYWGYINNKFISPLTEEVDDRQHLENTRYKYGERSYQYIGILDINNEEIYEEDIAKRGDILPSVLQPLKYPEVRMVGAGVIYIVKYKKDGFNLATKTGTLCRAVDNPYLYSIWDEVQVIGHAVANPDLLLSIGEYRK